MDRPKIPQYEQEPFWKYMNRLQDTLISLGLFRTIQQWELVMIIYENLNDNSKLALESISNFEFMEHSFRECWNLIKELEKINYELEMTAYVEPNLDNISTDTPHTHDLSYYYCYHCNSYGHDISCCPNQVSYVHDNSFAPQCVMHNSHFESSHNDIQSINEVKEGLNEMMQQLENMQRTLDLIQLNEQQHITDDNNDDCDLNLNDNCCSIPVTANEGLIEQSDDNIVDVFMEKKSLISESIVEKSLTKELFDENSYVDKLIDEGRIIDNILFSECQGKVNPQDQPVMKPSLLTKGIEGKFILFSPSSNLSFSYISFQSPSNPFSSYFSFPPIFLSFTNNLPLVMINVLASKPYVVLNEMFAGAFDKLLRALNSSD